MFLSSPELSSIEVLPPVGSSDHNSISVSLKLSSYHHATNRPSKTIWNYKKANVSLAKNSWRVFPLATESKDIDIFFLNRWSSSFLSVMRCRSVHLNSPISWIGTDIQHIRLHERLYKCFKSWVVCQIQDHPQPSGLQDLSGQTGLFLESGFHIMTQKSSGSSCVLWNPVIPTIPWHCQMALPHQLQTLMKLWCPTLFLHPALIPRSSILPMYPPPPLLFPCIFLFYFLHFFFTLVISYGTNCTHINQYVVTFIKKKSLLLLLAHGHGRKTKNETVKWRLNLD